MSELHFVRASHAAESVSPSFTQQGLLRAREKTWDAFQSIRGHLQAGVTEFEAAAQAVEILAGLGATRHWHKPYVRFGAGTALSFHDPIRKTEPLMPDQAVYIDLGPV